MDNKSRFTVTKEEAEKLIVKEKTIFDTDMAITIIMAELINGHRVLGTSIVSDKKVFNEDKGFVIARRRLIAEIIKYEVYNRKSLNFTNKD